MSSEAKSQGKDKDKDKSSKTHKRKPSSEPKTPSPFITRIVRRVKDACDEYNERMEDMKHGRRDSMGRQTQKGIEHYYEMERRRRKRGDRRRGKKEREQRKDAEGGGGGVVEALMTGGRGEPGHREGGSRRGTNDEVPFIDPPAMEGPIPETLPDAEPEGALPPPAIRDFAQEILPTTMEHAGSQGSRASGSNISPMPSDHSISTTRAQVGPRPIGQRARIKPPAGRGPPLDSEDEESPTSDEGSASEDEEDDQAAKEARAREVEAAAGEGPIGEAAAVSSPLPADGGAEPDAKGSQEPAGEEQPSGIRGGGDGGIVDLGDSDSDEIDDDRQFEDAPVYDEREDFDDEYTTAAGYYEPFEAVGDATKGNGDRNDEQPAKHIRKEFQAKDKHKDEFTHGQRQDRLHGESQGIFQSRERRPYNAGAKEIFPEIFTVRTPRPYAHAKVGESSRARRTEAPVGPGASHQHHTKKSSEPKPNEKNAPASFRDPDSYEDFPMPNSQPRACAGAGRTRDAHKNRSAKAGLDTEADFRYGRAYEPSQAEPNMKSNVHHDRRGDPFPNRESYYEDEYDEENSSAAQVPQDQMERDAKVFERHAAAFRERMERASAAPQKRFTRGAAATFGNRPYAMLYAETVPQPRFPQQGEPYPRQRQSSFSNIFKGPPYGNSFGAGFSFSRKPRVVPEDQESPVQDDRCSQDGFQSSDAGVSEDISSASEQSSDTEQIPKPCRKKAARRSYDHGYSSNSAEPPSRKPAKAKAERSRAGAGIPPLRSWRWTKESKRHATADSPPPPKYKDVVKDIPPNYYARLGLGEDATTEEIKKASKVMRVKTHPDQVKRGNPNMTEEDMAKVTATAANVGEAADVLEDPRKKTEYDERIRVWKRKHGGRLPEEEA
ncbi:MAG: hypothetical protein Q9172_006157 [Xanthocarpia lactea]